jgi:hypothetical protein
LGVELDLRTNGKNLNLHYNPFEIGDLFETYLQDYIIVESWVDNKKYFSKSNRYIILYEKNVGIIAISHY